MRPIVIVGAGGHARVIADLCRVAGRALSGFLDNRIAAGTPIDGWRVLGGDELLQNPIFTADHAFINGVATPSIRHSISDHLDRCDVELVSLVHPRATTAANVAIGAGVLIVAGAIVNPGVTIGDHTIINTGATVDHDCVLARGVQIGPGAHLGGSVRCESGAFIGLGASLIQGVTIGEAAIVGAGSVVLANVLPGSTVVGNPARTLRRDIL